MKMTGRNRLALLAVLAGLCFGLWYFLKKGPASAPGASPQPRLVAEASPAGSPAGEIRPAREEKTVPVLSAPASASPLPPLEAGANNAAGAPAAVSPVPEAISDSMKATQELAHIQFMVRDFRLALGGNPVGNNAEITRALRGANSKKLKLEFRAGQQLNAEGEVIDPWGTPYFFHQISGQEMEIRSAGPDHVLWNADDLHVR